ncbi:MAG TPA: sigma-70 family RNA polymerase sigma factor [Herbaspirillum sp.]|jgi:RNA polymerase sigma-70 factor (ECF subfamily)
MIDQEDNKQDVWQQIGMQQSFLLRLARLQLPSNADAEDVVQDAMIAALKGWSGFQHKSSLRSWLTGILRYKIIDAIRERRFLSFPYRDTEPDAAGADGAADIDAQFTADDAWHPDVFVDTLCPETRLAQHQLLNIVELCMRRLPEQTARLFLMREYLGLDLAEIELNCAISAGNLRVVLYRARMRLRECTVRGWGELN